MNVLVIDIGGTNVKILATGQKEPRKFPSGPKLSPRRMVDGVKKLAADWNYDVVSIGYPGVVVKDRILTEPHNLAGGWVGFNFKAAFRCPVKIINDAAMQALGSYRKGQMLFLGLGTVSAQPWSWKASWFQWNWATFHTGMELTRITSACAD